MFNSLPLASTDTGIVNYMWYMRYNNPIKQLGYEKNLEEGVQLDR